MPAMTSSLPSTFSASRASSRIADLSKSKKASCSCLTLSEISWSFFAWSSTGAAAGGQGFGVQLDPAPCQLFGLWQSAWVVTLQVPSAAQQAPVAATIFCVVCTGFAFADGLFEHPGANNKTPSETSTRAPTPYRNLIFERLLSARSKALSLSRPARPPFDILSARRRQWRGP